MSAAGRPEQVGVLTTHEVGTATEVRWVEDDDGNPLGMTETRLVWVQTHPDYPDVGGYIDPEDWS